ncbi:hypothetical protein LMG3431_04321 [Achromobacter pestifer]|uniref:Uncharacterized protein n=1 Tax=Achromobacter pestifer TaxID=1353889 RepID=A0A6S6ZKM1_9BURK|nr:hypothetical protein LMG3431_04321 [Achromobacter pestifer]
MLVMPIHHEVDKKTEPSGSVFFYHDDIFLSLSLIMLAT